MNEPPPISSGSASPPSLPRLLAVLLSPALACCLLGFVSRAGEAFFPVFLAVMALGSLGAGFWCGFGLSARLVRRPGGRVPIGILLGLVCTAASAVACFAGCLGGSVVRGPG